MWAEQIGMGEMGLSEEAFWSLTMPVFGIKHAAFMRAEDRIKSALMELGLRSGHVAENDQAGMWRSINALRRYPVKAWLIPDGTD